MTANQMIVLLDVYRGFDEKRHPATVNDDLIRLAKNGLIVKHDDWCLTERGSKTVATLKSVGGLA